MRAGGEFFRSTSPWEFNYLVVSAPLILSGFCRQSSTRHDADILIHLVADGKGEPLGEQPVVAKNFGVHTSVQLQGVDIGKERIEKIIAQAVTLPGIELPTAVKIVNGRREYPQLSFATFAQLLLGDCPIDRLLLSPATG